MNQELKLAMEFAIKQEELAYQLYNRAIDKTTDEFLKEKLQMLAEQEKMHKEKLESLNYEKLGGVVVFDNIDEEDVEKELKETNIPEFNNLGELFKFAISKEILSRRVYETLRDSSKVDKVKYIFELLANEEKKHEEVLKEALSKLN